LAGEFNMRLLCVLPLESQTRFLAAGMMSLHRQAAEARATVAQLLIRMRSRHFAKWALLMLPSCSYRAGVRKA